MAAKAKSPSPGSGNFFAVVGSDDGLVREKALQLYNQLTGGLDDGFTHETIDGIADNSDSAFEICSSTIQALQTIPMFGGDKVVWLRNANFLGDNVTGRSQRTESGVESLRAALDHAGEKGYVIATINLIPKFNIPITLREPSAPPRAIPVSAVANPPTAPARRARDLNNLLNRN